MDWTTTSLGDIGKIAATGLIVFAVTVGYARLAGLRAFAKMSNVDFASTIAVGSTMASVIIDPGIPILSGVAALGVLFLLPWAHNTLRRWSDGWRTTVDAEPTLLMREGRVLEANLARTDTTLDDLRSKLRQAGVTTPASVLAVVLETTGDFSVIQGEGALDDWLFSGVNTFDGAAIDDA